MTTVHSVFEKGATRPSRFECFLAITPRGSETKVYIFLILKRSFWSFLVSALAEFDDLMGYEQLSENLTLTRAIEDLQTRSVRTVRLLLLTVATYHTVSSSSLYTIGCSGCGVCYKFLLLSFDHNLFESFRPPLHVP